MKKKMFLLFVLCATCLASKAQYPPISHVETHNVRATILGNGTCLVPQRGTYYEEWQEDHGDCPTWEVPKGSGKETVFQHCLWVGGLDADDSLHFAANRSGQNGWDYWSGPLKPMEATTDMMTSLKFHHVWNLTRAEIEQFITHHGNENYQVPDDILTWPAHGEEGYAENLAPFVDVNADGRYNPADGDYPDIKGDRCLFFIFNDNYAMHSESGGAPFGLEVHAMVYTFDAPDDEALSNTVFFNYKIYNRSLSDYHEVYLGIWNDWDIGYGWDDYVGSDVRRGSCFAYNGTPVDGNGQPWAYGDNPPVQVCTVLAGPYMMPMGATIPLSMAIAKPCLTKHILWTNMPTMGSTSAMVSLMTNGWVCVGSCLETIIILLAFQIILLIGTIICVVSGKTAITCSMAVMDTLEQGWPVLIAISPILATATYAISALMASHPTMDTIPKTNIGRKNNAKANLLTEEVWRPLDLSVSAAGACKNWTMR